MTTFPPNTRLHHKKQFDAVYKRGLRVSDAYFWANACDNKTQSPRLGLAISAKNIGNAVNRNRVKRIIRESFRRRGTAMPSCDVVVSAKPAARHADNALLVASLEKLWSGIAQKCAR